MLNQLLEQYWLGISIWIVLMVSDNLLSMLAVKMYRQGAKEHLVLEDGSELNPLFQDDVANWRALSPKFMFVLATGYFVGWVIWSYGVYAKQGAGVFEFFLGLIILVHIPIHLRHAHTLVLFYHLRLSHGVEGKIRYASWLMARLNAVYLFVFSLIFFITFLFVQRLFFLGGVASCLIMAWSQWREANTPPQAEIRDEL